MLAGNLQERPGVAAEVQHVASCVTRNCSMLSAVSCLHGHGQKKSMRAVAPGRMT